MTDEAPTEASPLPPDPPTPSRSAHPRPAPPGKVTAAGIILLVLGTLSALGSAVALLWSLLFIIRMGMGFHRFDGPFDGPFGGDFGGGLGWAWFLFLGVAVALAVAVAGGHLAAGWGVLQRVAWGRILGLVVSGTALAILILSVLGSIVWVAALPDLREFDRVPEWFADWFRTVMTAGVGFGVLVGLVVGAAYVFVLWVLARSDEVFD